MTSPAFLGDILPGWVPWWAQLALLVLGLLFVVAFLMMPFAVFGLKGRLDLLEAQLDDIHAELRMLALRLPDPEPARMEVARPARRAALEPDSFDDEPAIERRPARAHPLRPDDRVQPRREAPQSPSDRDRSEPRLRWPPGSAGR